MFEIATGQVQENRHFSNCGRACAFDSISAMFFCGSLQSIAETLSPATAVDPGRCGPLQCPDEPIPHPSEVGSDVYGHQQQHRTGLSTEGLREVDPVPERHQSPETGQVGHQSDCCVPSSGKFMNQSDHWWADPGSHYTLDHILDRKISPLVQ